MRELLGRASLDVALVGIDEMEHLREPIEDMTVGMSRLGGSLEVATGSVSSLVRLLARESIDLGMLDAPPRKALEDRVDHAPRRLGARPTTYQPSPSGPPRCGSKRRRQWR